MMKRTSSGDGSKPAVDLAAYLPDAVAVFSRLGDCTAVVPTRSADSPLWLNMSAPALFEPTQVVLDTIEHAVMDQRVIVVECWRVGSVVLAGRVADAGWIRAGGGAGYVIANGTRKCCTSRRATWCGGLRKAHHSRASRTSSWRRR